MNRLRVVLVAAVPAVLAAAMSVAPGVASALQKCEPVRPESRSDQGALISRPGRHCVEANFDQRWLYSFAEGGRRGPHAANLIEIWARQVELDLQNHTLGTTTYLDGIVGPSIDLKRFPIERVGTPLGGSLRLHIHSGVIRLRNSDGQSSGIGVISPLEISYIHSTHASNPPPTTFEKVDYLLEGLTIKTGHTGVLLMGDGVVVRNCTIEVEGPNALVVYGPNAIIENNRIVYRYVAPTIRGLAEPTPVRPPEVKAAIYLRSAAGAIVRNNVIEVRDSPGASGIALIDSPIVSIESNRFSAELPVATLQGDSSARLHQNRTVGTLFNRSTLLPDDHLSSGAGSTK